MNREIDMKKTIQRWSIDAAQEEEPDEHGQWVKYADHVDELKQVVAKKNREIAKLKADLKG